MSMDSALYGDGRPPIPTKTTSNGVNNVAIHRSSCDNVLFTNYPCARKEVLPFKKIFLIILISSNYIDSIDMESKAFQSIAD